MCSLEVILLFSKGVATSSVSIYRQGLTNTDIYVLI